MKVCIVRIYYYIWSLEFTSRNLIIALFHYDYSLFNFTSQIVAIVRKSSNGGKLHDFSFKQRVYTLINYSPQKISELFYIFLLEGRCTCNYMEREINHVVFEKKPKQVSWNKPNFTCPHKYLFRRKVGPNITSPHNFTVGSHNFKYIFELYGSGGKNQTYEFDVSVRYCEPRKFYFNFLMFIGLSHTVRRGLQICHFLVVRTLDLTIFLSNKKDLPSINCTLTHIWVKSLLIVRQKFRFNKIRMLALNNLLWIKRMFWIRIMFFVIIFAVYFIN